MRYQYLTDFISGVAPGQRRRDRVGEVDSLVAGSKIVAFAIVGLLSIPLKRSFSCSSRRSSKLNDSPVVGGKRSIAWKKGSGFNTLEFIKSHWNFC